MTTTKTRYSKKAAQHAANQVLAQLQADPPACDRVTIAGSIRRGEGRVGDIEILAIPNTGLTDLFGNQVPGDSALDHRCHQLVAQGYLALRPNVNGGTTFGPKNKLLVHVESGIPVDIFTADRENWGMALLVRTGPANFCKAVMARFLYLGMAGHAYGGVTRGGVDVPCPDEETVFRILDWPYLSPERRGKGGK